MKRLTLSLLIFILVFFILGVPFIDWGFSTVDDFPVFFHSQAKNLKDLFFGDISAWDVLAPCNYVIPKGNSFSSAYYRPMMFISYYAGSIFWGSSAYCHFLFTIFLHALNAVLLFNLFTSISSYLLAFLATMFFAFNPSYACWMGWIAAQQYPMGLFFLLISIVFFKQYLDKRNYIYFILSGLSYLLTILGKEVCMVFPAIAFIGTYLYETKCLHVKVSGMFNILIRYLKLTFNYWVIALLYLTLRACVFPLNFGSSGVGTLPSFGLIYFLRSKIYYLFVILTDLFGLWWVPWGYPRLKALIYLFIFSIFIWLFIKSSQKLVLVFCLFSTTLFWWPIALGYFSRYLYESIPFVCLFFLFGVKFYKGKVSLKIKEILLFFISCFILLNASYLLINIKFREQSNFIINKAFDELVASVELKNRNLCFIGVPSKFSPGCERAIWVKSGDYSNLILHDLDLVSCISGDLPNLQKALGLKVKHYFDANEFLDKNYISIEKIKNGFRFISLDSDKLWFIKRNLAGNYLPIGQAIINGVEQDDKICDVSLIIDSNWLNKRPVFITWDYLSQKFKVLGEVE